MRSASSGWGRRALCSLRTECVHGSASGTPMSSYPLTRHGGQCAFGEKHRFSRLIYKLSSCIQFNASPASVRSTRKGNEAITSTVNPSWGRLSSAYNKLPWNISPNKFGSIEPRAPASIGWTRHQSHNLRTIST
eukprot:1747248-Pyramimonas_sp.AAC.1